MKKISIIIPVFNEEESVTRIVKKVIEQDFDKHQKEIIIVNDGSTDRTKEEIEKLNKEKFIYIEHGSNLGKGAAIKSALKEASGDFVIAQDADTEYNPADISLLLKESGEDTVVYGSRELQPKRRGYPHYVLGVRLLTLLLNLRFKSRLTDSYTCYKLFPIKIIKSLNLSSNGFEIEMELMIKTLKKDYKIKEVAISYSPRKFKEGKKINFKDAIKGIVAFFKY